MVDFICCGDRYYNLRYDFCGALVVYQVRCWLVDVFIIVSVFVQALVCPSLQYLLGHQMHR